MILFQLLDMYRNLGSLVPAPNGKPVSAVGRNVCAIDCDVATARTKKKTRMMVLDGRKVLGCPVILDAPITANSIEQIR